MVATVMSTCFFHRSSRHPQMMPGAVMDIARAEGLSYLSFKAEAIEFKECTAPNSAWDFHSFIGEVGVEAVSDFHGHVYTVYASDWPEVGFPMRLVPWPMHMDVAAELEKDGGALVYAHPHHGLSSDRTLEDIADPNHLIIAREWPVDVALGVPVAFDLLCEES